MDGEMNERTNGWMDGENNECNNDRPQSKRHKQDSINERTRNAESKIWVIHQPHLALHPRERKPIICVVQTDVVPNDTSRTGDNLVRILVERTQVTRLVLGTPAARA